MRWSSTQRGVHTRPAGIHGTRSSVGGSGAPRSSSPATTFSVCGPCSSATGDDVGQGLTVGQPEPVAVVVAGCEQAESPVVRKLIQARSTCAACLISPARHSSLTVGRLAACSSLEAVGGVAQGVALLAEEGQQAGALVGQGGNESGHRVVSVSAGSCRRSVVVTSPACAVKLAILWPLFLGKLGRMRADRLVAALLVLQSKGRVTAAELARELEVSERTARRDLEGLAMAGIPVYSQPGRHGGWELVGGARTDLSGLTADEARALFLIAGPGGRHPGGADRAAQARARLAGHVPPPRRGGGGRGDARRRVVGPR